MRREVYASGIALKVNTVDPGGVALSISSTAGYSAK
jgi:hypothetical protein